MNEDDLARRIVARLEQNLSELPEDVVGRLEHARKRALQNRFTGRSWYVALSDWGTAHRMMLKVALPTLFLLVAAGAVFFLQNAPGDDPFDVEAALMADELPLHAYTDPGFDAWLRKTSHEEQ